MSRTVSRATRKFAVYDQLDRASTSIPLNIAEGNGKFSKKDRCRYLDIARRSALESAACLDVLVAKSQFKFEEIQQGKQLQGIVSMLMGLIANFSDHRISEDRVEYGDTKEAGDP